MVSGSHGYNIARKLVDLHKQKGHDALDLTGLVAVPPLFADRIELIEKENTRHGARVVEQPSEASIGLAEVGADQCIVSNSKKLHRKSFRYPFRNRGLSVAGWSRKQDAMPWLHAVRSKEVCSVLLFDKLFDLLVDRQG